MRAIVMREHGGPGVLQSEDVQEPALRTGHVRVHVSLAGVSADDVLARTGAIAGGPLPRTLGTEVVGMADDGRRVVGLIDGGGYAEKVLMPLDACWDVPAGIDDFQALALVRDGIAAWHALFTAAQLQPNETIVVTEAGSAVGVLTIQLAQRFGARVIALVQHPAEGEHARELGADAVVDSTAGNSGEQVTVAAGGTVDTVIDFGGGRTVTSLLTTLAPGARVVMYGHPPVDAEPIGLDLLLRQSLSICGFQLPHLYGDRIGLAMGLRALFATVLDGTLVLPPGKTYPLAQAAQAHLDLEAAQGPGLRKLALDATV
ncbi:zinc-binding dehydrogenase [Streptomyces sp. NPDC005722]